MASSSTARRQAKNGSIGGAFTRLGDIKPQCNALVFGDAGTGKTTFATMYAPQPVAFINFDRRARHAVKRAMESGRDIQYMEVDFPANVTKLDTDKAKQLAQKAVNQVIDNFELAVRESEKGNIRTIALDTGTEYSELLKIAITGRIDRTKGDYGQSKDLINREWWRLCNLAREGEAHFVILSRAKAIWENSEPTGSFTFRGPEVMNDAVDWAGHMRLKPGRKGKKTKEFQLEITKGGINIDELGSVYSLEDWEEFGGPFVWACMMQYGTGMEDWL